MVDHTPEQLRRLWQLPEPTGRLGRPASLTTEDIVGTAVELADQGGLEAAALPKIARELRVTAMSLYRHIGSKRELVELMVDFALTPPTRAKRPERNWRNATADWAEELWDRYRTRPWVARAPTYNAPAGPNQLEWLEQALASLACTDLAWGEKIGYAMLVNGYVRQSALLSHDLTEGLDDSEVQSESEHNYGNTMRKFLDPKRFPELSAMFDSEVFNGLTASTATTQRDDFRSGLSTILDGIAHRLEQRRVGSNDSQCGCHTREDSGWPSR